MTYSYRKLFALLFLISPLFLLVGCRTAPGAPYAGLTPVDAGKGDVYLYRTWALAAMGQDFQVRLQDTDAGRLYNESYLVFRLDPGPYKLTVSPGPFGINSNLNIEVKAGERNFYQYDFATGLLANAYFIGSSIEPRTQAVAEAAMKELIAGQMNGNEKIAYYPTTKFADLKDVDAVPRLNQRGRDVYKTWLTKKTPRAFVIASDNSWIATWGVMVPNEPADPTARGMQRCSKKKNVTCKVYAIDNRVVWVPDVEMASKKEAPEKIVEVLREQGYEVMSVTPVFSQLLRMSVPPGFRTVFENTTGGRYIREAVLEGEDLKEWSQMLTLTGAKDLVADAAITPASFAGHFAAGFQHACPASFSQKTLSEATVNGYDQYVAVVSCGQSPGTAGRTSESALIMVIKGERDYYTVQWAERGRASATPQAIDMTKWLERHKRLAPVRLCARNPGEQAPYPGCMNPPEAMTTQVKPG